jgi:NAD(P)H-hydrate epimerase
MSGGEVITRALPEAAGGVLDETAADSVLEGLDRFRAMVVGPGLGTAPSTVAAVRRIVTEARLPLLLDADGLNAVAGQAGLLAKRMAPTILTPHDGEYARLAGAPPGDDRVAAARSLAAGCQAVVLLKGPASVIAAPDGRVAINVTGNPHLATAGTGDVLSGIIGAFLARSMGAFEASVAGAYIHGVAGGGPDSRCNGLIAGDLIDALPRALPGG